MYLSPVGSVEGSTVVLGDNTAAQGIFRNLPAGVVSVGNVNMHVANTRFENILPQTGINYPIAGKAIHFVGFSQMASTLFVSGQSAAICPVFNACTTAIDVRSASVQIRESTVTNCRYGFIVQQVSNAPIDIQGDIVHSFTRAGIDLRHNDGALSLRVSRNDLRLAAGAKGTAISIQEAGTRAANRTAIISSNAISLYDGSVSGNGIWANTTNNLHLLANTPIQLRQASDQVGIYMVNGDANYVDGNEVASLASDDTPGRRTGMVVESTTNTTYACNDFLGLHTGVKFLSGNSEDTDFQNNFLQAPMVNGLHYEDMLTVGQQNWRGNSWNTAQGAFTGKAALNEVMAITPQPVFAQRYLIHSTTNGFFPPSIGLPNYTGTGQPWFVFNAAGTPPLCQTDGSVPPGGGKVTEWDGRIVAGDGLPGGYADQRIWESRKYTYGKLQAIHAQGLELSSANNTWRQGQAATPIGAYQTIAMRMAAELNPTVATTGQLDGLWATKWQRLTSVNEAANQYAQSFGYTDYLRYVDALEDLSDTDAQLTALLTQSAQSHEAAASQIGTANSNLAATTDVQQNEKVVNGAYLKALASGESGFSTEAAALLLSVANQCPLAGGKIVHKARSLYQLVDADYEFDNGCSPNQALQGSGLDMHQAERSAQMAAEKSATGSVLSVHPNPVASELFVTLSGTEAGVPGIYSPVGQLLLTHKTIGGETLVSFDTQALASGIYYLQFADESGKAEARKIVIIR